MADTTIAPEESAGAAGDKKLKKPGDKKKTWYVVGGGTVALIILIYFLHKSASGSSTAATSSNIDPATGYPTGSAADLAALAASGTSAATPGSGSGYQAGQEYNYNTETTSTDTNTQVEVPNLAGLSAGQAHNILVSLGLKPTAPSAQKANMKVSSLGYTAGEYVTPGSSVNINTKGYVPKGY
jgi:hypothetical protein